MKRRSSLAPTASALFLWAVCLVALGGAAPAEEGSAQKSDENLQEERPELAEADFPDLVAEEEEDALMDEFAFLQIEEAVYAAAKHEQDISEAPSSVTVITREQIENTYCLDVVCLLRQVPEVDVLWIQPMYAAVGARALTDEAGDKVLLLIDGREINNEVFGSVFWQMLPVHLNEIERIEVIRGPGSALYGANAYSLVVSISTRKEVRNLAEAFIGAGEQGRSSLMLRLGREWSQLRAQLSGGLDVADRWGLGDYVERWRESEFPTRLRDVRRLRLSVEHNGPSSLSSVQLGFGTADGFVYSVVGPASLQDLSFTNALVSHQLDWLRAQLSFDLMDATIVFTPAKNRRKQQAYLPVSFGGITVGKIANMVPFLYTNLDVEAQATFSPLAGNLLILGGNYRWMTISSNALVPDRMDQQRVGVFLQDEQRLFERLTLTGGVRFDYNTITPFTVSPRLSGVWKAAKEHSFRLGFGRAFRKPSFFNTSIHIRGVEFDPAFPELEEFFHRAIGNEDLGNESITSFEAGYLGGFFGGRLRVEGDIFYNRYRDTIIFHVDIDFNDFGLPNLANSSATFRNAGREVDSVGGSISATWRIKDSVRLGLNYTFRHSFFVSEPSGHGVVGKLGKGDRVPWEPAHLVNLSFHHLTTTGLRYGVGLHASSGRVGVLFDKAVFEEKIAVPVPANCFISGFIAWRLTAGSGWVEVGLRAFDVFKVPFRDFPGVSYGQGVNEWELGGSLLTRLILLVFQGAI